MNITAAWWVLAILFFILIAAIGAGIILQLEDIQTSLRLMDVACPSI